MPEGDTIFKAARAMNKALAGKIVTRFESALPKLTRVNEDAPLTGRTVLSVSSRGKWSVMRFSGDLFLLTHMLMNGTWHLYRSGEHWQRSRHQMRIAIETTDVSAVAFSVPIAEFHTERSLSRRVGFRDLGPDVLAPDFDPSSAQRIHCEAEREIGEVLIDQRIIAALGNVFKSEVCFICGVNPFSLVRMLTDDQILCLTRTAQTLMLANVKDSSAGGPILSFEYRRTTGRSHPAERVWVYGRTGKSCLKCGTPIQVRKQNPDARTTFWCPQCQQERRVQRILFENT